MKKILNTIANALGLTLSTIGLSGELTSKLDAALNIVLLVVSIISVVITSIFVIVDKVKQVKADGKVTIDEIEGIVKTSVDELDKIKDSLLKDKK